MMMAGITKGVLATLAGILLLVANNVAAVDYMVGDMQGWSNGVDFQGWAKDKVFMVGDRLVFQYSQGSHNVFKVDGEAFENCEVPLSQPPLLSGNDIIELTTPGKKWYICGIEDHCSNYEQKLAINVVPAFSWWLPSSPPPSSSPSPRSWFPWPMPTMPPLAPAYGGNSFSSNGEQFPCFPWTMPMPMPMPIMPPSSPPTYGGYSNSKNDENIPCFPFPLPMMPPSSAPAYGGYSNSMNDETFPCFPWPMAPSPDTEIPPFRIPYIPVGNAPSPSPYFSRGNDISTDKNTNNNVESPWMLPTLPFPCWVPGIFPPAIAPSPTVDGKMPYAMNEYSSDAHVLKGKIAQTLMVSVGIVLAMAGLV